jgi:hypothetical protein
VKEAAVSGACSLIDRTMMRMRVAIFTEGR